MRTVVMTLIAVAWLTLPALAQSPPNGPPGMSLPKMEKPPARDEPHSVKADEKAYKSALDGIQPKQSYDPWGNVREKPKASNSR
jgi:hypothetical protein